MTQRSLVIAGISLFIFCTAPVAAQQPGWKWQHPLPQGNTLNDIAFVGGGTWFAVGDCGTILRSSDDGATWDAKHLPRTGSLTAVDMIDAAIGFAVGDAGSILKTTDSGNHWSEIANYGYGLYGVSFGSEDAGIAVGINGYVFRTSDAGATWAFTTTEVNYTLRDAAFSDPHHATVVGDGGIILRSDDGGVTWTSVYSGVSTGLSAIHFSDAMNGLIVGASGVILRSADGGATWTMLTSGMTTRRRHDRENSANVRRRTIVVLHAGHNQPVAPGPRIESIRTDDCGRGTRLHGCKFECGFRLDRVHHPASASSPGRRVCES